MNTLTPQPNGSFKINSRGFSGALTRSGGEASNSLYARLCLALGNVADVDIFHGTDGWYVTPVTPTADSYEDHEPHIEDIDTASVGEHTCNRCVGTGQYITRIENGKPVGPGGKCYRCAGKGYHDASDRARNLKHDLNYVPTI